MAFIRPYRTIGELNPDRAVEARAPPPRGRPGAIIDRYSKRARPPSHAVPGEVERLKWVGLYPQRQGGDAFMMRIKVPGGVLTAPQAGRSAWSPTPSPRPRGQPGVRETATADITTRQTSSCTGCHRGRPGDLAALLGGGADHRPGLWGLGPQRLGCPVAGVDADEAFDALPVARAISAFFTGNREYANLPRKFKISVTGCLEDCAQAEINDIGLWPAQADDGTVGFNVLAGGGLSDGAADGDGHRRLRRARPGGGACPGHRAALRGARQPRAPGPVAHALLVQELGPEGFRTSWPARARLRASTPPGRD